MLELLTENGELFAGGVTALCIFGFGWAACSVFQTVRRMNKLKKERRLFL